VFENHKKLLERQSLSLQVNFEEFEANFQDWRLDVSLKTTKTNFKGKF